MTVAPVDDVAPGGGTGRRHGPRDPANAADLRRRPRRALTAGRHSYRLDFLRAVGDRSVPGPPHLTWSKDTSGHAPQSSRTSAPRQTADTGDVTASPGEPNPRVSARRDSFEPRRVRLSATVRTQDSHRSSTNRRNGERGREPVRRSSQLLGPRTTTPVDPALTCFHSIALPNSDERDTVQKRTILVGR